MGPGEMEDGRSMVIEDECVWFVAIRNLGARLVLIFIRASILVWKMVVVVVGLVFF